MAELVCFPQGRNVGKARHVAERWLAKSSRDRETYWTTVVGRMAGVMLRIGFSDEEVGRQTEAFRRAVQAQIDFATHSDNRTPPGAA
jgi:hypothetical protein